MPSRRARSGGGRAAGGRARIPPPRLTPGFQQVEVGITEADVGMATLGEAGVRGLLSGVAFEWAFGVTARIDRLISHGERQGRRREAQLAAVHWAFDGHPQRERLLELIAREERVLFRTPYLHAVQRLLVQEAPDGEEARDGDLRRLQDAFVGTCQLVTAGPRPKNFDRGFYLAQMSRSLVSGATEPPAEAMARAYTIYHELPRRDDAAQVPNFMPRDLWEPAGEEALSVHERFMLGMVVMARAGSFDEQPPSFDQPAGVPPGYFQQLADELDERVDPERFIDALAAERDGLRARFDSLPTDLRQTAQNTVPFQMRPLLKQQQAGGYLLSSTDAVASWTGRGVHYACLRPIERTKRAHQFLTYVGALFELYALELMRDAHKDVDSVRVLGEQTYDRGQSKTSDIALHDTVDGDELVLVEVEARRFSLKALLSEDLGTVLEELDLMVIEKAKQLDDCIEALIREEQPATLPGVDTSSVTRIWPVLVLEGAIAQTPLLREHVEERLQGRLTQPRVQALSVLAMSDLEAMAGHVEHGHRVAVTLRRWKHSSKRDLDFGHYCASTTGLDQRRRPAYVDARWKRLNEEMAQAFSEDARRRLQDPS